MSDLRPFWRYYGGKWRAAPKYPTPRYGTIMDQEREATAAQAVLSCWRGGLRMAGDRITGGRSVTTCTHAGLALSPDDDYVTCWRCGAWGLISISPIDGPFVWLWVRR